MALLTTMPAIAGKPLAAERESHLLFRATEDNIVKIEPPLARVSPDYDYLVEKNIVLPVPGKDKARQAFEYNGGQFQLLIPKRQFPLPAPHCRKNIILRMPGTNRTESGAEWRLALRWHLFQTVHAVAEGKIDHVDIPIQVKHSPGFAPYMRVDKHGHAELEWCNAFIDARTLQREF